LLLFKKINFLMNLRMLNIIKMFLKSINKQSNNSNNNNLNVWGNLINPWSNSLDSSVKNKKVNKNEVIEGKNKKKVRNTTVSFIAFYLCINYFVKLLFCF
jgi:hypothetical protein